MREPQYIRIGIDGSISRILFVSSIPAFPRFRPSSRRLMSEMIRSNSPVRNAESPSSVDKAVVTLNPRSSRCAISKELGSSGKWGGGTWFGGFRIPNLVPRSLVNIVGCSSRGRGNCGKLRATSNWASKPAIRSFPSAVRTVEKQLRALASSPPELLVFPRFA